MDKERVILNHDEDIVKSPDIKQILEGSYRERAENVAREQAMLCRAWRRLSGASISQIRFEMPS